MRATTELRCSSKVLIMSVSTVECSSMMSSPSMTTNGSSPTCLRATDTAWPRPSGSPWRTKWMSASSASSTTSARSPILPFACSWYSSSKLRSKWSSRLRLFRPVMMRMSSMPAATASSTTYWIAGLSTTGSISLGCALVAGRNRVPRPAAGMTALVTVLMT